MVGEILDGHYEILNKIGQGGFAAVYRARDTNLKREVAIKILNHPEASRDFHQRFRRESEWLAGFKHPNIVAVYDICEHAEAPCLVMELVCGAPLAELVETSPLPAAEARELGLQVCRAMAYSHGRGVIHRDLTLKNIMVEIDESERPVVKILDFGLAKYLHEDVTRVATTMGTAPYLSPEQIQGEGVDGRADIFAFGVCLYRMVAGSFPFHAEHPTATMYQICNREEIDFPDAIDPDLRDLIGHCLQKKPQDRPRGFGAIVERLQQQIQPATASTDHPAARIDVRCLGQGRRVNPYLNRTMIRNPGEFHGRRREIRRIYSALDADDPQSISIVGDRRIGKSSLLNFIYHRENRQKNMTRCGEAIFVYLDFQGRADFDMREFIEFVIGVIRIEDRSIAEPAPGEITRETLRSIIQGLHGEGRRLIVLMDEFEHITRNPGFDRHFFSFLRSLAMHHRVAYVTSSYEELQRMCHQQDISDSPFFNIFANLPLRPFRPQEARSLIVTPSQAAGLPLAAHADRALSLAGCFPLFLQIACSCLFEEMMDPAETSPDWPTVESRFLDEARPHFEYLWEQRSDAEREILSNVATGRPVERRATHIVERLVHGGYVQAGGRRHELFSSAFRSFVASKQTRRRSRNPLRNLFRR